MTTYEFLLYSIAYQVKAQETAYFNAQQAWLNQAAKATKKVGKEIRSVYRSFDDFYDNDKEFRNIFTPQSKSKKRGMADMNRILNKKGG